MLSSHFNPQQARAFMNVVLNGTSHEFAAMLQNISQVELGDVLQFEYPRAMLSQLRADLYNDDVPGIYYVIKKRSEKEFIDVFDKIEADLRLILMGCCEFSCTTVVTVAYPVTLSQAVKITCMLSFILQFQAFNAIEFCLENIDILRCAKGDWITGSLFKDYKYYLFNNGKLNDETRKLLEDKIYSILDIFENPKSNTRRDPKKITAFLRQKFGAIPQMYSMDKNASIQWLNQHELEIKLLDKALSTATDNSRRSLAELFSIKLQILFLQNNVKEILKLVKHIETIDFLQSCVIFYLANHLYLSPSAFTNMSERECQFKALEWTYKLAKRGFINHNSDEQIQGEALLNVILNRTPNYKVPTLKEGYLSNTVADESCWHKGLLRLLIGKLKNQLTVLPCAYAFWRKKPDREDVIFLEHLRKLSDIEQKDSVFKLTFLMKEFRDTPSGVKHAVLVDEIIHELQSIGYDVATTTFFHAKGSYEGEIYAPGYYEL